MRALILGFASMAAVGVCQTPAALLAQERPPIIDMHLHADLPPHDVPPGTPALCRPEPCLGRAGRRQVTPRHSGNRWKR